MLFKPDSKDTAGEGVVPPRSRPRGRIVSIGLVLLIAGGIGYIVWSAFQKKQSEARTRPEIAVPVLAATPKVQDVPVYLDGVGTVRALNNVTVRAQVDGKLMSINFKEGQDVKAGDVIAEIDPAIYQAQYDQAVAKKAQDEALQIYRRSVVSAFADVDNALVALRQTSERLRLQGEVVSASRRAFDLAEQRLRAGTADIITVLNTQLTLFQAEDSLAQVRLSRFLAVVSLYQALGGGWSRGEVRTVNAL